MELYAGRFIIPSRGAVVKTWARWILVVASSTTCATGAPAPVAAPPEAREVEVDLRIWGLDSVRDVGFVELTVSPGDDGPRLIVQRIEREPPSTPTVATDHRPPDWVDDAFVIARFAELEDNRLGGFFAPFQKSPSRATATLEEGRGLTLKYQREAEGWAGMWVHLFDDRAHPSERRYLDVRQASHVVFEIDHVPDELVSVRVADRELDLGEEGVPIGRLRSFISAEHQPGSKWRSVRIPIASVPPGVDRSRLAGLIFLIDSPGAQRFTLRNLGVVRADGALPPPAADERPPRRSSSPAKQTSPADPHRRALWVWVAGEVAASAEETAALLDLCERWDLTHVYLQVPRVPLHATSVQQLRALEPLIRTLHARGVLADALEGHPAFVLKEHHATVLATTRAVAEYNASVDPSARFAGVRFDNEPYLLPGFFGPRQAEILQQYLDLLDLLGPVARAGGLKLGVDIPFWFDGIDRRYHPVTQLSDRPLSDLLLDRVDHVTLMDYRTMADGPDGVIAHAKGELAYADEIGKRVSVGLETVELPDERILEFAPEGRGDRLALVPSAEDGRARLIWFGPTSGEALGRFLLANPEIPVLGSSHESIARADKVTFHGQSEAAVRSVMQRAEKALREHPSFDGFALHSYRSLRLLQ